MKSHYRAVVIGGGIVGVSVLYHLARAGWAEVALIERAELTAGSTWHAAAGFHAFNSDAALAELQGYTINLYPEIERLSGQSCGLHRTGGISLATTPERWVALQAEWAKLQTLSHPAKLMSPEEIASLCPIVSLDSVLGGLYDELEGHCDPHGTTHALAGAARAHGADIVLRNRVTSLAPTAAGGWRIETEHGLIEAEHVVNAGGLWARRIGRMTGVDLPVVPMQHHYLVTEEVPALAGRAREMPAITDLEGHTYLRQEGRGVLLGIYERHPRHWRPEGAAWDYGMELIPDELDRISDELAEGLDRFPPLRDVGIRRAVNGALTFTPDGNPLVGPVPGLRNYWVACGCMAGFSQHGAMALALARWMVEGDPGCDAFGMDVARYGDFATDEAYLLPTTAQFYARRFVMSYPNELLPAGRPFKTSPSFALLSRAGGRFAAFHGLEVPMYFAPGEPTFEDPPSLARSVAERFVAAEVEAVRTRAGLFETAAYARYEVHGPGAAAWLDRLLACRLPRPGAVRLAPMLTRTGRLAGEFTVSRLDDETFWLVGSYAMQGWHLRWFSDQLPSSGVELRNLSDAWVGFAISGPATHDVLGSLIDADLGATWPFLTCRRARIAEAEGMVARLSFTGELGYEISVPAADQERLGAVLLESGQGVAVAPIGVRALESLRLEKAYKVWGLDLTLADTPGSTGLDRFVAFDKPDFIGRDAALRERERGAARRLVLLAVDVDDADAHGFEPVWLDGRKVGHVTSGAYGHHVRQSLALASLADAAAGSGGALSVHVNGVERPARILAAPPHDPDGARLRG